MHFTAILSLLSVVAVIPSGLAAHLDQRAHSHNALAARASSELLARQGSGSGTRFSFYYPHVDAGACGTVHQDNELVVAMNTPQWAGGSHCYKSVTLKYNGKSVTARVVDRCVECPYGALDLSPGAFSHLGSTDQGYLWGGSWSFGNGGPSEEEIAAQKAKEKAAREKAEKEEAARQKAEQERKEKEAKAQEEKEKAAAAVASSSRAAAAARSSEAAAARSASSAANASTSESAKPSNTSSANVSAITPAPEGETTGTQFIATANNAYAGLGNFLAAVAASK